MTSRVAPNLRSLVYSTGIKDGTEEDWDFVFRKYMAEPVASEKKKLMVALTSSKNETILKRFVILSWQFGHYIFILE